MPILPVLLLALPSADGGYRLPPPEIVEVLDAPSTPTADASPDGRWILYAEQPAMPTIAEVARPWVGLAGLRLDADRNARHTTRYATGLAVQQIGKPGTSRVALPEGARVLSTRWSHAGPRIALTLAAEDGIELWLAEAPNWSARRVASGLNAVFGAGFDWMPDGERLLVTRVPAERGEIPRASRVPEGPAVQETSGVKTALRTYQDLLATPHDERLFAHLAAAELAIVDPRGPSTRRIGGGGAIVDATPSPDGLHLLVTRLEPPWSYVLPWTRFPHVIEVWSAAGEREHVVARVPLGEGIPQEGVRTGPRDVQWQPNAAATLVWCEALDGGDPSRPAEFRDRWLSQPAPFTAEPVERLRLEHRARGLVWLESPELWLASEYDRDRRWTRTRLHDLSRPDAEPRVVEDRSVRDRYGDPGRFEMRATRSGTRVVRQDGNFAYRTGRGSGPEGDRPFLDRVDLTTLATERLWQCAPGTYESPLDVVASSADRRPSLLTSYESPTEPPNYRLRDLEAESVLALTEFPDPQPRLRGVRQELVKYRRADGVELSARLYLPPDHEAGTRLPLVVWAYPLEYSDPDTAGQVSGSASRFVRVRGPSQLLFALHGYAVMDGATMPVIGDPESMNDTFLAQVVEAARAAIDHAVELGVADGDRAGVGGHSYGAFMTANLLAHCDLFRAGIARSGAYNRSLTPFGFQSERRTLWEARDAYIRLSPFFAAERIDEPLLLIHGEKDDNMGTFPMQSERLYQAIGANGGTARLVFLPEESHGYAARESVLHTVAEMLDWFDRHVKAARPRPDRPVEAAGPR